METVLQCYDLSKNYGSFVALNKLNLALPGGKIIGLLGPNGSGKTTLIKLIAGLLTPTSGSLRVCDKPIGPESKALVSYLPDRVYFDPGQRISQLLTYFSDMYQDFDRPRAEDMMARLGISLETKFRELSKGGQEKVQLCLVMSRRARLYLLDEPIAGVDPAARDYILQTIISNYDPQATVMISTHLISDVERVLDDYLFIYHGQILQGGNVDEARTRTGKSLDQQFREVFRCLPSF